MRQPLPTLAEAKGVKNRLPDATRCTVSLRSTVKCHELKGTVGMCAYGCTLWAEYQYEMKGQWFLLCRKTLPFLGWNLPNRMSPCNCTGGHETIHKLSVKPPGTSFDQDFVRKREERYLRKCSKLGHFGGCNADVGVLHWMRNIFTHVPEICCCDVHHCTSSVKRWWKMAPVKVEESKSGQIRWSRYTVSTDCQSLIVAGIPQGHND